ncbi:MAG TPA: Clp protease N-terminal domain-containing protein, partial [Pirellulales bacterium]|nr:Clp protease N-terminal domain-containing protein [Pirellulales bacterium]
MTFERSSDRGLHVVDASSMPMVVLSSIVLWERKVGRVALERIGLDRFGLAGELDRLLDGKADEFRIRFDKGRGILVFAKTNEPYTHWDIDGVLEPLLSQAEREASGMGHNYVGSEHLVLSVIVLADPVLSGLLQK